MRILAVTIVVFGLVATTSGGQKQGKGKQKEESVIQIDPQGRPARGKEEALLIWQDDGGWHLRCYAGGRKSSNFTGMIRVIDGRVNKVGGTQGLERTGKNTADFGQVSKDKKVIRFELRTIRGGEDGFDFELTPTATQLEFNVLVDRFDHPERIRIGASGQQAPGTKFLLPVGSVSK
jgi:hypothetical protein